MTKVHVGPTFDIIAQQIFIFSSRSGLEFSEGLYTSVQTSRMN